MNEKRTDALRVIFIIVGVVVSIGALVAVAYTLFKKYFKVTFECDGDCCDCDCDDCMHDCEDEDEELSFDCPNCGKTVMIKASDIDFDESPVCSACGQPFFVDVEDEDEE